MDAAAESSGKRRLPDFSDFESIAENPFRRAQLSHIQAWIRGATLDVGSNFGRLSALSASTVSLDVGRRWLLRGIELGNITRGVVGSALALPFNDGCFDTVLAIGITEHIPLPSMSRLLDELSRVTKRGGRLVINTSSPYALFALLRIKLWSDYLHPYSPFRLRRALLQRGWYPLAWMSSGLLGITSVLSGTARGPVPWARSVGQVFIRGGPERGDSGRTT